MATIKSYTDLSQSKKLAEILPIESADMRIGNYVGKSGKVDGTNIHYYTKGESFGAPEIINAWSLAALLDIVPYAIHISDNKFYRLRIDKGYNSYAIWYEDNGCTVNALDVTANNFIDACYEMLIHLNKLNLL